jgi:hypothetical protein
MLLAFYVCVGEGKEAPTLVWNSELYDSAYSYQLEKTAMTKRHVFIAGSYFKSDVKRLPPAGSWLAQYDNSGKKLFFKNFPDDLFDGVESLYVKHDQQIIMVFRDKQRKSHISKLGANNQWELAKELPSGFHTSSILELDNGLLLLMGHKNLDSSIIALDNDLTIKWEKTVDLGKKKVIDSGRDDFFTDAIRDGQGIIVAVNSGKMEQFFMGESTLIIGTIKLDGCCFKELFKTSGRGGFVRRSGTGYSIVFDKQSDYKKEIVINTYDKNFAMKTQKTLVSQKMGLSPFSAVAVEGYWVVFMEDMLRPRVIGAEMEGNVLSNLGWVEQPPGYGVFGDCFDNKCAVGYTIINQDAARKWSNKIKLWYLTY